MNDVKQTISSNPEGNEVFSKDELSFVEAPPSGVDIECPICLQVMLNDPHLTSCGHHFCGPCIKQVKDGDGPCPVCKEKTYQIFPDASRLRFIRGLQVYCTNKDSGCEWSGELKDLADHINKGMRDGECQYEEVKCYYYDDDDDDFWLATCATIGQRHLLDKHEKNECLCRPYTCQYCGDEETYQIITEIHYDMCTKYPVSCTYKCCGATFQRDTLQSHLDQECPLQPVECQFKWAGCNETPLRKDLQEHISDSMMSHFTLLAIACGKLKKENEKMREENEELKKNIEEVKKENGNLKKKIDTSKKDRENLKKEFKKENDALKKDMKSLQDDVKEMKRKNEASLKTLDEKSIVGLKKKKDHDIPKMKTDRSLLDHAVVKKKPVSWLRHSFTKSDSDTSNEEL